MSLKNHQKTHDSSLWLVKAALSRGRDARLFGRGVVFPYRYKQQRLGQRDGLPGCPSLSAPSSEVAETLCPFGVEPHNPSAVRC